MGKGSDEGDVTNMWLFTLFAATAAPKCNYRINVSGRWFSTCCFYTPQRTVTLLISGKYPTFLMKMKWFRNLVKAEEEGSDEFSDFINETDENRIQNASFYLKIKGPWVATEKIDWQSGTFFLKKRT